MRRAPWPKCLGVGLLVLGLAGCGNSAHGGNGGTDSGSGGSGAGGADAGGGDAGPGGAGGDAGVDASAPACVTGSGALPRPLQLPGAEPNGAFDPNLARDPASGRVWMSYSGVTGPAGTGRVSTHLAYSDDDGDTSCDAGIVNPAVTVPTSQQPPEAVGSEAHWNHETSSIVYDPGAPAAERWRLIWHRYIEIDDGNPNTDNRHFEHGWIAQRKSATAAGLVTAPEEKLFTSTAYYASPGIQSWNDAVVGLPEHRFDTDPDLGSCLAFAEPGAIAFGGDLYVAMFCYRSASEQDVVLVRLDRAAGDWVYAGTLLTTADAQAIQPSLVGFNGADLFQVGGKYRLVVSPTTGAYLGCIVYGIDLATATLTDVDGKPGPDPLLAIPKTQGTDIYQTGACTYQEGLKTGIIYGDTHISGPQFRLVASGQQPP